MQRYNAKYVKNCDNKIIIFFNILIHQNLTTNRAEVCSNSTKKEEVSTLPLNIFPSIRINYPSQKGILFELNEYHLLNNHFLILQ